MSGYISELDLGGSNRFIEIALPAGTDASGYSLVVYNESGNVIQTLSYGPPVNTSFGSDIYVIDAGDGLHAFQNDNGYALAVVNGSGTVEQFISLDDHITANQGPANGQSANKIWDGDVFPSGSLETTDGGSSYQTQSSPSEGSIPRYAPGTLIDTPDGPRAVETLRPGDLVLTVDHGAQPVRWVRSGDHPLDAADTDQKPVLIAADALGPGRPTQDLIVSPQHRILVGGGGQLVPYFDTQAFAPAKALTRLPGIRHMKGKTEITWVHFACDRHEVVIANGCQSESLLLGPMVVNGLDRLQRHELTAIYGALPAPDVAMNGPAARACLKVGDVRRHLARCRTDRKQRAKQEIQKWDVDLAMERYEAARLRDAGSEDRMTDLRRAG